MTKQHMRHTAQGFMILLMLNAIFASHTLNAGEFAAEPAAREAIPAVVAVSGLLRTPGTENEYRRYGQSSGFLVDQEGFLLTIYSPYLETESRMLCDRFEIEFSGGQVSQARLFAVDPGFDLAVLKMAEAEEYPALDISFSPEIDAAEEVWAIAGKKSGSQSPVFSGRIITKDKSLMYEDGYGDLLINSYMELPAQAYGGPLVNGKGEVLGINIPYTHRDANGQEISGEEHTVPVNDIATIYRVLLANPTFEQKWLGFSVRPISLQEMALVKQVLRQRGGAVIDFIWKEGPAANTGLRNGDIVVKMNGNPVLTPTHFKGTLFDIANNSAIELTIIRDGVLVTEQGRVEKRPAWAAP